MTSHGAFIFAAYGVAFCVIAGMAGAIIAEHVALRRALAKFPARGGDADET